MCSYDNAVDEATFKIIFYKKTAQLISTNDKARSGYTSNRVEVPYRSGSFYFLSHDLNLVLLKERR